MDTRLSDAFRSAVAESEDVTDLNRKLVEFIGPNRDRLSMFGGQLGSLTFGVLAAACTVSVLSGFFVFDGLSTDRLVSTSDSADASRVVGVESELVNALGEFNSGGSNGGLTDFDSEAGGGNGQSDADVMASAGDRSESEQPEDDSEQNLDEQPEHAGPSSKDDLDTASTSIDGSATPGDLAADNSLKPTTSRPYPIWPTTLRRSTTRPITLLTNTSQPKVTLPTSTSFRFTTTSNRSSTTGRLTTRPPTTRPTTTRQTISSTMGTTASTTISTTVTTPSITTTTEQLERLCRFAVPLGATISEAKAVIRDRGCVGEIVVEPSGASGAVGTVVGGYTQTLPIDSTVTIYGRVVVPNVIGMSRTDAASAVSDAGLTPGVGIVMVSYGDERAGTVIAQAVESGSSITYREMVGFSVAVADDPIDTEDGNR